MSAPSSISSDLIAATAATVVCARPTRLNSLVVVSDGTNTATAVIYDNASAASGKVVAKAVATSQCPTAVIVFDNPVRTDNGLTIAVTGTGSGAIVHFDA